jgi:hypothetical protein
MQWSVFGSGFVTGAGQSCRGHGHVVGSLSRLLGANGDLHAMELGNGICLQQFIYSTRSFLSLLSVSLIRVWFSVRHCGLGILGL